VCRWGAEARCQVTCVKWGWETQSVSMEGGRAGCGLRRVGHSNSEGKREGKAKNKVNQQRDRTSLQGQELKKNKTKKEGKQILKKAGGQEELLT